MTMYDMHQRALLPVSEKAIFVPLGLGGEIVGPCSFDTAECWDRAAPTSKPHRFGGGVRRSSGSGGHQQQL